MGTKDAAARAVDAIVRDLSDRRGLRQAWESIDDEVRAEIERAWAEAIRDAVQETQHGDNDRG